MFHVYDDHEIANNFAGEANFSTPPYPNASDAYNLYNHQANYDSLSSSVIKGDKTYYDFRYADVAFFVMDTRLYRSNPLHGDSAERTMLGDEQLAALYDWLGRVNSTATFKFVVTSVPFTSLWTHDAQTDSWAGYAVEKAALLSALHSVPNVIVLSGDRHEFAAVQFNALHEASYPVFEFSTSPLSMFYIPFVRTLKPYSEAVVKRVRSVLNVTESGEEVVATQEEEIPQEVVMKYIPVGNYKW
jgi:alkaline phosphatase D